MNHNTVDMVNFIQSAFKEIQEIFNSISWCRFYEAMKLTHYISLIIKVNWLTDLQIYNLLTFISNDLHLNVVWSMQADAHNPSGN